MQKIITLNKHVWVIGAMVLVALGGCGPSDGDEGGSSTAAGSEATDGSGGAASEATSEDSENSPTTGADSQFTGIAFLRADKPKDGTVEPPPGDPADLLVDLGSYTLECADPYAFPMCSPDVYHRFSFVLTPAQQQPGTYPVAGLAGQVDVQSSEDSPCESNGPFPADSGGTIEVVSIDAAQLVVRLTGTEADLPGGEGEHTVLRCAG